MSLYRKATQAELAQLEPSEPQPAAVLTTTHKPGDPVLTVRLGKDRHKPGYMAEYMRKRRAKK